MTPVEFPWNSAGMLEKFFCGKKNKVSADWVKAAVYLDTEDQDTIQYIFNVPKNDVSNNDGNNIENNNKAAEPVGGVIDLKKSSGATQVAAKNIVEKYRNLARKKPYKRPPPAAIEAETNDDEISNKEGTINTLDTTAELQPGKNTQTATKKFTEK